MALSIEHKKAVVAEVAEVADKALAAVAAEYRGLTVEEMTELRAQAREDGVFLKVAKNTLVRRALEGTDYECMQDSLTGPLLFAFSMEEPGAAARLVKDYAKDHDNLIAKLVAVGGAWSRIMQKTMTISLQSLLLWVGSCTTRLN
jgi:large subunit ribosomal protein L10